MPRNQEVAESRRRIFVKAVVEGRSFTDAYKTAFPNSVNWVGDGIYPVASKYAARPETKLALREARRLQSMSDILTSSQWLAQTVLLLEKAELAGNLNAAQALNRQLGQATGALREHVIINQYDALPDDVLIQKLARGDPVATAVLAKLIGKAKFDA